jgi:DNA-binding LacI/PurR family transcriptional regulator
MPSQTRGSGRPVGIRDVARLAEVSVATASLALNGQPGVAVATRGRIVAAAEQLGYHANSQAQALRTGRSTTYGLVVRNFANPFFIEVLGGAQEIAAESGTTLIVLDSGYSLEREREHVREMAAQRFAGLAISSVGTGESIRLWQEARPGAPVVALNSAAEGIAGVSRVRPDNAAAVELPMRRLAELGHHRIAFLTAPPGLMADPDRLRHFRRLARALDLEPSVLHSPLTLADVQQAARQMLAEPAAPTAIITNSDYTAHAGRAGHLHRRSRRPAHLRTARSAADDRTDGPARHGPRADAAAARAGAARRSHRRRRTGPAGLPDRTGNPAGPGRSPAQMNAGRGSGVNSVTSLDTPASGASAYRMLNVLGI